MFAKQIKIYEDSHFKQSTTTDYDNGVKLWQSYGLSQKQYDEHLVYKKDLDSIMYNLEMRMDEDSDDSRFSEDLMEERIDFAAENEKDN